jgi:osmoprotectant transport system substrate-binding protein
MKRKLLLLLATLAAFSLVTAACSKDKTTTTNTTTKSGVPSGPAIKIGAQKFGESAILGEIYGQVLSTAGYKVSQVALDGYRPILLAAYDKGDVNLSAEYAASMLEELNAKKGEATSDAAETVAKLQTYLDGKNLVALTPSDAVDTNAFVIHQKLSDDKGIKTLSDLAAKGAGLKLVAPEDCKTNPFCIPGLKKVYGLDLAGSVIPLAADAVVPAFEANQAEIALVFSTDARIKTKGWVLLTDDKHMLAADNVVPVLSKAVADAYGADLTTLLDKVSAKLTTQQLIDMNKRYDVDKEDAKVIAADWIKANM